MCINVRAHLYNRDWQEAYANQNDCQQGVRITAMPKAMSGGVTGWVQLDLA